MAIKLDRKTPGVFGVLFGAVASMLLGALLAVVSLISKPVEIVNEAPEEPVEGTVYFVRGAVGGGAATWESKWRALEAGGGDVAVSAGELNAWSGETFTVAKVEEGSAAAILINAGRPNFRLVEKELQIAMENEVHFFGGKAPLVFQVKGTPERVKDRWVLRPDEAYLGSLPLHRAPALLDGVAKRFAPVPSAELKAVLDRATAIEVVDGELVFRLR